MSTDDIPSLRFSVARDGSFSGCVWSYYLGQHQGTHLIIPPNFSCGWDNAATYTDLYLTEVHRVGNLICGRARLVIDNNLVGNDTPWSALLIAEPNGAPAGLMHWPSRVAESSPDDLHDWTLIIEQFSRTHVVDSGNGTED